MTSLKLAWFFRKFVLLIALGWVGCFVCGEWGRAGEIGRTPTSGVADAPPGAAAEREAERLERRDESTAAQLKYQTALKQVLAAARQSTGEAATEYWARAEYFCEKIFALTTRTGDTESGLAIFATISTPSPKPEAGQNGAKNIPSVPPFLRARATWLAARIHLREGRVDAARRLTANLGVLRNWLICGSFANERGSSFAESLPPEKELPQVGKKYHGKRNLVGWREVRTAQPLGYVDLAAILRPRKESLAYAFCLLKVETAGEVVLRTGADDTLAVWLNGREVDRVSEGHLADLDQTATPLQLHAGWNALLLKIGQAGGAWGFYARLTDRADEPLSEVKYSASLQNLRKFYPTYPTPSKNNRNAAPTTKTTAQSIEQGALGFFSERVGDDLPAPRDQYYLGYLLWRRYLGGAARMDQRLLSLAARGARTNAFFWLTMSALAKNSTGASNTSPDREDNVYREGLEQARKLDGEEVAATVGLGRYYLERMANPARAARLAKAALQINPSSSAALLLQVDIDRARGWRAQAQTRVRKICQRNPANFAAQLQAGKLALKEENSTRAEQAYGAAYSLRMTDGRALHGLHTALLRQGRQTDALALLREQRKIQPYDEWTVDKLVATYRAANHPAKALAVCDRWLALVPDDYVILTARGHILQALNRPTESRAAWAKVLKLQPEYPPLRKYLRRRGDEEPRRTTKIPDLGRYIKNAANWQPPTPRGFAYLLFEHANRLNADGTRRRSRQFVLRVTNPEKALGLNRYPVYFAKKYERVSFHTALVRHANGGTEEARISGPFWSARTGQNYWLLRFPPFVRGDVLHLEYSLERFQADFFGAYFSDIFTFRRRVPMREVRYVLTTPARLKVFFHRTGGAPQSEVLANLQKKTAAQAAQETVTRVWEMRNQSAIPREDFMPPRLEISPSLQVSTFRDWNDFSRWYWHLVKTQNIITPEIAAKARELTAGLPTEREKVAAIHRWVTKRIRPVAWEFGVHGYQPYTAEAIFKRGFGDCKDTATLISVMAREVGLESWPVLLRSVRPRQPYPGRGREDITLPVIAHFNHCLALVRAAGEDILVDGVGGVRALANLPFNDAGAAGVVVMPEQARQITVPPIESKDNAWLEKGQLEVLSNGALEYRFALQSRGQSVYRLRKIFRYPQALSPRVLHSLANKVWGKNTVRQCKFSAGEVTEAVAGLTASLRLDAAAGRVKKTLRLRLPRVFLRGPLAQGYTFPEKLQVYARHSTRVHDVVLSQPFLIERAFILTLPSGWEWANRPAAMNLRYAFGRVERTCTKTAGGQYQIHLLIEIKQTRISVVDYADFRRLCLAADRLSAMTFELVKK